MLKKDSDEVLVKNVKNGDLNSEKILYSKYKDIVEKYLRVNWPNIEYHEDVTSEVLIKMLSSIDNYDSSKSKFSTWVLNIAKNSVRDEYRKIVNKKKHFHDFDISSTSIGEISFVSNTTTYDEFLDNQINVDRIMNSLSKDDFDLLNMKYVQGYSYSEIGDYFNITSTTASNRVNYLKTKLKKDLID